MFFDLETPLVLAFWVQYWKITKHKNMIQLKTFMMNIISPNTHSHLCRFLFESISTAFWTHKEDQTSQCEGNHRTQHIMQINRHADTNRQTHRGTQTHTHVQLLSARNWRQPNLQDIYANLHESKWIIEDRQADRKKNVSLAVAGVCFYSKSYLW